MNKTNTKFLMKKTAILFSISLAFLFSVGLVSTTRAACASFYLEPEPLLYDIGEQFSLDLMINAKGSSANAAQVTIYFPSDKLKVVTISKSDSIFTLWPKEPTWSDTVGEISFVGGLPSPGFIGKAKVFTITFEAQSSGRAEISFSDAKVLADDPQGTDVCIDEDQENFFLDITSDFIGEINISIDNEGDPTNPSPLLYVEIKANVLGVLYYEVKIDEEIFKIETEEVLPWQMPLLGPGEHSILVKAIDSQGNTIEEKTKIIVEPISEPQITFSPRTFKAGEEVFYIRGTALPESSVLVFLKKNNSLVKKWEVKADSKGDWFLRQKKLLIDSGTYRLSVTIRDLRGAESNPSQERMLSASLSGIALGTLLVSYRDLTLMAIFLLAILLGLILYLFFRITRARRLTKKEVIDLRNKFYKEYHELCDDIKEELSVLRKLKGGIEFTQEEKELERRLLSNLADVERVLTKELKDIEDIK